MSDTVLNNNVIVTVNGSVETLPLESLELTMESTNEEVLVAVKRALGEISLDDPTGECSYTVSRDQDKNAIMVFPKPVAG